MPKANEPQGPFPAQQENPSRTKDEALRKAREALKASKHGHLDHAWADEAIKACNQALATPAQPAQQLPKVEGGAA